MPDKIGRYEIIKEIGRGRFGAVYQARDPMLERQVALKLVSPLREVEPGATERLRRELGILARLRHPGLLAILDLDAWEDGCFLVTELASGGSLAQAIEAAQGPLPLPRSVQIAQEAAEALAFAHRHSVVHLGLKPANILFGPGGRVMLSDFAATNLFGRPESWRLDELVFVPPEQVTFGKGDERSDIYSLGVIFFQMVTGRLPHETDNLTSTLLRIVKDPVPSVATFNPGLPQQVVTIIDRCLAHEAGHRYLTVQELLDALGQVALPATDRLTVWNQNDTGRVITLERDSYTLGRAADCEIRLPDARVSRRHARLQRADDGWLVEDLGSANGTFLEGSKLAATSPQTWQPQQTLRIGPYSLQLRPARPAASD